MLLEIIPEIALGTLSKVPSEIHPKAHRKLLQEMSLEILPEIPQGILLRVFRKQSEDSRDYFQKFFQEFGPEFLQEVSAEIHPIVFAVLLQHSGVCFGSSYWNSFRCSSGKSTFARIKCESESTFFLRNASKAIDPKMNNPWAKKLVNP